MNPDPGDTCHCPTCTLRGSPCATHRRPQAVPPGHGPLRAQREELLAFIAELIEWRAKVARW